MMSHIFSAVVVGVVVDVVGDVASILVAVLERARSLPYRSHIGRDLPLRLSGVARVGVALVLAVDEVAAGDGSRGGDLALVVGEFAADGVCLGVVVDVRLGVPVVVVGVVSTLLLTLLLSGDEDVAVPWFSCQWARAKARLCAFVHGFGFGCLRLRFGGGGLKPL